MGNLQMPYGFRIIGEHNNDVEGITVSNAGDVNNDGFDDYLVCADQYPSSAIGLCYLLFGGPAVTTLPPSVVPLTYTPTEAPTNYPTNLPSSAPSNYPTLSPTYSPSWMPSPAPTSV